MLRRLPVLLLLVAGSIAIATSASAQTFVRPTPDRPYGDVIKVHVAQFMANVERDPLQHGGGRVLVKFTIDPMGRLLNSAVARSSCSPRLDRIALGVINKAQPYPVIAGVRSARTMSLLVTLGPITRTGQLRLSCGPDGRRDAAAVR